MKWEYWVLIVDYNFDAKPKLDALGEQGWELVSTVTTGGSCVVFWFFLKRPVVDQISLGPK